MDNFDLWALVKQLLEGGLTHRHVLLLFLAKLQLLTRSASDALSFAHLHSALPLLH